MVSKKNDEGWTAFTGGSDREISSVRTGYQPTGAPDESKLSPGLYLVATPIGNIRDVTLRALDVLALADVLACEDSRVTAKLLRYYGITATKTFPYHEHNAEKTRPKLISRLKAGKSVALVSDAGTPLVSDPGFKLVREALEQGIPVHAIPGPSAGIAALVSAGLPTDRFLFAGFLPQRQTARRKTLQELAAVPATLIFYESPRRLADSLADMAAVLGPRQAAVARELTKLYEEVRRDSLDALARHYTEAGAPKGEIVLVVSPPGQDAAPADIDGLLRDALGRMSLRDAAAAVSDATGRPRREIYSRALEIAGETEKGGAG
jgi:16S rRNA (cytidine1402-2'-O)-methyltransferase